MENPTRKAATTGAAALLTVGLVIAGAGAAEAATPAKADRITSAAQLSACIAHAAQLEQEAGNVALSDPIGGQLDSVGTQATPC
ncbi:hypothetical protein [Streptomyces sp. NPDC003635]